MQSMKKAVSLLIAGIFLMASFTACSFKKDQDESAGPYSINGTDIPIGLYLLVQQERYFEAGEKVKKEERDLVKEAIIAGEDGTELQEKLDETDLLDKTIDGVPVATWIEEETLAELKRYIARYELAEELDLAVTADEMAAALESAEKEHTQYAYFFNYFGIGLEAVAQLSVDGQREAAIFSYYYDEVNGTTPLSEEEIKTFFKNNYAKAAVYKIDMSKIDEEDREFYITAAQTAADGIDGEKEESFGEAIKVLNNSIDSFVEEKAAAEASEEESSADEESSGETSEAEEESSAQEEAPEAEEELEKLDTYASVFKIDALTYAHPNDVIEAVLTQEDYKKFILVEGEDGNLYIVARIELGENLMDLMNKKTEVIKAMVEDEFDAMLDEKAAEYEVASDTSLLKKYDVAALHKKRENF